MEHDIDIRTLERIFAEYAADRKNFPFYTSGLESAKIIYRVIFENTKDNLMIVLDQQDLDIISHDKTLLNLLNKLSANAKIQILLNNAIIEPGNKLFEIARGNENLEIRENTSGNLYDLVIADNSMTRIESNPDKLGAFVNFNDIKFIDEFLSRFKTAHGSSRALALTP